MRHRPIHGSCIPFSFGCKWCKEVEEEDFALSVEAKVLKNVSIPANITLNFHAQNFKSYWHNFNIYATHRLFNTYLGVVTSSTLILYLIWLNVSLQFYFLTFKFVDLFFVTISLRFPWASLTILMISSNIWRFDAFIYLAATFPALRSSLFLECWP